MQDDEFEAPGRRPSFDYAAFGLWYDRCYESVLRPSLARAEATVDALLRDSLAERDLARIRRHAGRVKTKQRLWRKLCQPRYVARIDTVEDIPEVIDDLPTGASRIVQRASGFEATICAGEVTFRNGSPTGARPGRLIRGKR